MELPHIPGLNFNPIGSELLIYLKQRILDYFHFEDPDYSTNRSLIPDIELHHWDPKELPRLYNGLSEVRSNGRQWFFFCLRKEKYRKSGREERTVPNVGYWKITSSDKKVKCKETEIGKKRTLTFYRGRIACGRLTGWGMHEYHLNPSYLGYDVNEIPYVACCVFKRSGKEGDSAEEEYEQVLSNHARITSESRPRTYPGASTEEEGTWQPLPEIPQLPHDLIDCNSFTEMTNYDSYTDGAGSHLEELLDCQQLCRDDWYSQYY